MSRVDDDRQAQRVIERLALEKQKQEARAQKKQEGETAFSRLLSQGTQEKGQTQRQQLNQTKDAQAKKADHEVTDPGSALHEADSAHDDVAARSTRDRADARRGAAAFGDKLKQARAGDGERASEGRRADSGREGLAAGGRAQDQRGAEGKAESRRADAKLGQESHDERGGALGKAGGGAAGRAGKGELKADADGGGGKGGSGKDKGGKEGELAAGFRFNPALMAPVPVAKPKAGGGSERLRALANEIAQKIVQSARVGTNAAGKAEFQIDLHSNVLSGLSIKVSGGNGKIRAVFSGNDREILKLLEAEADTLKQALTGRGLTLEEFRIEERA